MKSRIWKRLTGMVCTTVFVCGWQANAMTIADPSEIHFVDNTFSYINSNGDVTTDILEAISLIPGDAMISVSTDSFVDLGITPFATTASFQEIPFSFPVAPILLWEVSTGVENVQFFLGQIQVTDQSDSAVALKGTGFLSVDGGARTPAVIHVGGLGSLIRADVAAVAPVPIADGGSMVALLGIAMLGLETLRKKQP